MGLGIVGGGVPGVTGCNPTTNEVGPRETFSTSAALSSEAEYLFAASADCTGTLGTAHFYHNSTTQSEVKICVYNKLSSEPTTSDTLVGCSNAIDLGTTTGDKTGSMTGTYNVTNEASYYVTIFISTTANADTFRNASTTVWYKTGCTGCYASPPGTLNNSMSSASNWGDIMAYITIQ